MHAVLPHSHLYLKPLLPSIFLFSFYFSISIFFSVFFPFLYLPKRVSEDSAERAVSWYELRLMFLFMVVVDTANYKDKSGRAFVT